jgi:hypothetical protein
MLFGFFTRLFSEKEISITAQPGNYKTFLAEKMISETIGGKEGHCWLDPGSCSVLYQ